MESNKESKAHAFAEDNKVVIFLTGRLEMIEGEDGALSPAVKISVADAQVFGSKVLAAAIAARE